MNEGGPILRDDGDIPLEGAGPSSSTGSDIAGPLLSPLREMQLVEAYRQGDPEAVGTLLRSYQRRMYSVCYRMLRNEDEARDLTQDSMVKVLEGLTSFDARARLSTWIVRVTMNTCLSYLRKRRLRKHISIDSTGWERPETGRPSGIGGGSGRPATGEGVDLGEPGPQDRVQHQETRDAVLKALDLLDPQMRAVLILRDMHHLDYLQIAEVIEKPVGTVKSRLFRARLALREAVEGRAPGGQPPHAEPQS